MSGNGNGVQIPLGITPVNVLGAWQQGANIGQTQANALQTLAQRNVAEQQAGLVGQQAVGAGINNQLAQLGLGYQKLWYGGMENRLRGWAPTAPPPPNALAAAAGQGTSVIPSGAGATGTGAPVNAAPLGAPPGGQSSSAQNGNALAAAAPPAPGSLAYFQKNWGGVDMGNGFSMPAGAAFLAMKDPATASSKIHQIFQDRRQALATAIAGTYDLGSWNRMLDAEIHIGYLHPNLAVQFWNHPELRDRMLAALATPESQLSYQGTLFSRGAQMGPNGTPVVSPVAAAAAGNVTAAQQGNTNVTVSPISSTSLSPAAAAYRNGGAGAAAPPTSSVLATPGPLTSQQWLGKVQSTEHGAPGVTSATSSATGPYQFTAPTWKAISGGLSFSEANNPAVAGPLAVKLATQNAAALQGAGMPVNSATLGLAHFLGADGATAVMRDPVNTPMARAVPADVVQANPWVRGLTTGQVAQRFAQNYGLQPVQLGAAVPGFQVQGPQPAGAGATTQTTPGGGETISSTLTPGAVAGQTELAKGWPQEQTELAADAASATQQNAVLDQMKVESQGWTPGSFVSWREGGVKALDTLGRMVGFTPSQSIGNYQAFEKNFVQLNAAAARAISSRVPLGEWQGLQRGLPNAELSPTGVTQVVAELQGFNDWKIARAAGAARYNGEGGAPAFNAQWIASAPLMPFILHRMDPDSAKCPSGNKLSLWNRLLAGG